MYLEYSDAFPNRFYAGITTTDIKSRVENKKSKVQYVHFGLSKIIQELLADETNFVTVHMREDCTTTQDLCD